MNEENDHFSLLAGKLLPLGAETTSKGFLCFESCLASSVENFSLCGGVLKAEDVSARTVTSILYGGWFDAMRNSTYEFRRKMVRAHFSDAETELQYNTLKNYAVIYRRWAPHGFQRDAKGNLRSFRWHKNNYPDGRVAVDNSASMRSIDDVKNDLYRLAKCVVRGDMPIGELATWMYEELG